MFSQIKDRKHIEQNFHSVAKVVPRGGTAGCWGVKNFSVGICEGDPSTACSSMNFWSYKFSVFCLMIGRIKVYKWFYIVIFIKVYQSMSSFPWKLSSTSIISKHSTKWSFCLTILAVNEDLKFNVTIILFWSVWINFFHTQLSWARNLACS